MTTIVFGFVLRPFVLPQAVLTVLPKCILRHSRQSPHVSHLTVGMSRMIAATMSTSLVASRAASFKSLEGRVDPALLAALRVMKFETMSPVQEQVMATLPDLGSDW